MKKFLILGYILLSGVCLFAQIDSTHIVDAFQTGSAIANQLRPQQWIDGVDNSVTTGFVMTIVTTILGLISRRKAKKKLRKVVETEINSKDSNDISITNIKKFVDKF